MSRIRVLIAVIALAGRSPSLACGAVGQLELMVHDAQTGEPIAAQIQLTSTRGNKTSPVHPPQAVAEGAWDAFDGRLVLKLNPGTYQFRLQRGLEYLETSGHFVIQSGATDHQDVALKRFATLRDEGWYSGDLCFAPRRLNSVAVRVLAADLQMVPVARWSNLKVVDLPARLRQQIEGGIGPTRILDWFAGRDIRPTGALWMYGAREVPALAQQLPRSDTTALPSAVAAARIFHQPPDDAPALDVHASRRLVHLQHVTANEAPVWVAAGQVDTVGVLHGGLSEQGPQRVTSDRMADSVLYPPPQGDGRWAQHIYFQFLETGLHLAPAANSDADERTNRLGFNRTYVYCGHDLSSAAWWDGLQAGRSFVTNGPLLRPRVNDQLPGHVFTARSGDRVELQVALTLSTTYPVEYLELIKNGRATQPIRLQDWAAQGGQLPPVEFTESGWLIIRAVSNDPHTYRCAMTAPYYVEFDGQPRRSKAAAQFFVTWVDQRIADLKRQSPAPHDNVWADFESARRYWQQQVTTANAD